jgi:predicted RNA binding protein YcfA (HicA-like mRNA interferase family)
MPLSGDEVVKLLAAQGFVFRKGKGTHKIGRHSDGRTTTVPLHKELKRGTLASIERQTGVTLER